MAMWAALRAPRGPFLFPVWVELVSYQFIEFQVTDRWSEEITCA